MREETGLEVKPIALAGHDREAIAHVTHEGAPSGISSSSASPAAGLPASRALNDELDDARWLKPAELAGLTATEGLAESSKRRLRG